MRLLIAHGDATAREALRRTLASSQDGDFDVIESGDGEETMELLLVTEPPHVAVVDWDMPGCDGLELCRLVRAFYEAGRPYIILLAKKGYQLAEGLQAGADDCVQTPVQSDELRARVAVGRRFAALSRGQMMPVTASATERWVDDADAQPAGRWPDDIETEHEAASDRGSLRLAACRGFDDEEPTSKRRGFGRLELQAVLCAS